MGLELRIMSIQCEKCSLVLSKYDSFVSFRAIGVIWGIRELTAELACLLFWTLFLVPTLWGTLPCPYPVGDTSLSLPCGGLFLVATLWGTLPCPYPAGDFSLSLPCGGLCLVPYPAVGLIIKDMKTICTWSARE